MRLALIAAAVLLPTLALGASAAGGISWTAPKDWKEQPARPMRAATYSLPVAGGVEAPELAVFYFGEGQGGSVEANIERWAGQFESAGGKASAPKTSKSKLNGVAVTRVSTEGTYTGAGGPMAPKSSKPGFRLLGAIVEGPAGPVFFKLTGPAKGVAAAEKGFEQLLRSVRPAK